MRQLAGALFCRGLDKTPFMARRRQLAIRASQGG